jgi:hypothetical protein
MRKLLFAAVAGASLLVALFAGSLAVANNGNGSANARAHLNGYNEVPGSISTVARGEFRAKINKQANTIEFRLTYTGIEGGTATAAHIHFGQRHTAAAGNVSAWLCGGGTKPSPCPSPGGTVTGTIAAADVVGPAGQGIAAGEIAELIRAIRAGATYVNVHSTTYGGGEIRGQIRGGGRGDD